MCLWIKLNMKKIEKKLAIAFSFVSRSKKSIFLRSNEGLVALICDNETIFIVKNLICKDSLTNPTGFLFVREQEMEKKNL